MSDRELPKSDWKDNALALGKFVGSAIPFAGGPIVEGLNFIDARFFLGKRLRLFLEDLNRDAAILQEKGKAPGPEELAKNEAFITTLLHAIQAATRSHQKEKLKSLRNAVLNSALPSAPDEDMQLIFINLLDSFTAFHLKLLFVLDDPEKCIPDAESRERAFPEIEKNREFYTMVLNDLKASGLAQGDNRFFEMEWKWGLTTDIGHQLVEFIKSPTE